MSTLLEIFTNVTAKASDAVLETTISQIDSVIKDYTKQRDDANAPSNIRESAGYMIVYLEQVRLVYSSERYKRNKEK